MRLGKYAPVLWLSWLVPGAVLMLIALLTVLAIRGFEREIHTEQQTMLEKGVVLIRALESGARVGMGMRMHHIQLQQLLEEMAWQPGVLWFAVTDEQGNILAHSNPARVGEMLYPAQEMAQLPITDSVLWRRTTTSDASGRPLPTFEIYRKFQLKTSEQCQGIPHGWDARDITSGGQVIFVAFDARELDSANRREQRNAAFMLSALAAVLLMTVLSIFWFRRYQQSRHLLLEANKRKEKLQALGHLAAGVAHEVRNPLSSIKGIAKYFAERTQQGGESHELAQVMAKEADRLNRVVSELLELVKPAHLALQLVDLNDVISHSLQLVSQDAQSRDIALHYAPNASLCRIEADPDRLTQVLLNLYLNAIHAIGRQGTIQVEARECDGQRVRIVVRDSGQGIAPEQLQAIFTPYFTTKADGTGLGLAVVQNIIEQHGGTIQATSVVGSGAVFTLDLPVKVKQQKD